MSDRQIAWLPIPGWEGLYEASDDGQIRSLPRPGSKNTTSGRVLRQRIHPRTRYLIVDLYREGKSTTAQVHKLVLRAFCGLRPDGMETRHLDGDRANNALVNLVYGTHTENMQDAVAHGTHQSVVFAKRTHCKHNHEYTPENTRMIGTKRCCRTCARRATARSKAKKGAQSV